MGREVGARYRCDGCGAEIVYAKACPCPPDEPTKHAEICCGKEMRAVGVAPERTKKETVPT